MIISRLPRLCSKRNYTIDFTYYSRIRRVTCFEQFCYTWKTTGDITRSFASVRGIFTRIMPASDFFTFFHIDVSPTGMLYDFIFFVLTYNFNGRDLGLITCFDNHLFLMTGLLIHLFTESDTFNDILEFNLPLNSERITALYGSQVQIVCPFVTYLLPSLQ